MTLGDKVELNLKRSGKSPIKCWVRVVKLAPDTTIGITGVKKGSVQVVIEDSIPFWVNLNSFK